MNQSDFCLGFFFGFLFAGVVAFLLRQIQMARIRITDGRKQRIDAYSQRTPKEEVRRSNTARTEIILLSVLLIAFMVGFLWFVFSLLS